MFDKDIFILLSMMLFFDTVLPNLSDFKMSVMSQDRLFKAILQFLNSWLNLFVFSKRTYYILWRLASEESQAANFYSFNKIQIIFSENFRYRNNCLPANVRGRHVGSFLNFQRFLGYFWVIIAVTTYWN